MKYIEKCVVVFKINQLKKSVTDFSREEIEETHKTPILKIEFPLN